MDPSTASGGEPRPTILARISAVGASRPATALIIVAVAVASWPVPSAAARAGLDPSFAAMLGYSLTHGQRFGGEILYTYGPLGFLGTAQPWYGPLTLLALLFVGGIHLALCAVIVVGARRILPWWGAAIVAYPAAREMRAFLAFEGLLILVTCVALAYLLSTSDRHRRWLIPLAGLAVSVGLLGKLNAGVFVGGIAVVTVAALVRPWWRGLLLLGAWTLGSSLVLWLGTGQRLTDIPAYAAGSFELISGFSQAMGIDPGPQAAWYAAAYAVGVGLVGALALREASGQPRVRRVALVLVGLLAAFAFFKTGFVRWHIGYAMALPVLALFAVGGGRTGRIRFMAGWLIVLLPAVAVWGDPLGFANPITSVRSLYHQASLVARPWTWSAAEETTRAQLRATYALEPAVLDALRGHSVHVDPWETAVLVAWPELTWRPLPVFQGYTAYTPALDEGNAAVLRGASAPERILREASVVPPGGGAPKPVTLDGRFGWFEAPAAMLETFCRYDEAVTSARWEVLALTDRRCGTPEPLTTRTARLGETVTVPVDPRPDRFVIVRVHGVEDGALDRIITTLYKSPEWHVTLDGSRSWRLVPGTAGDGLLMAVPTSIVRSPAFAFGSPITTIAIDAAGQPGAARALTYEFLSVPLVRP